jgi:hypothetical protein
MFKQKVYKFRFLIIIVLAVVIILAIFQWSWHILPLGLVPPIDQSSIIPVTTGPTNTTGSIRLFLSFSYNVEDPAAIAKYYDFVWGAQLDHVQSFRTGNPHILLGYYIPFYRDQGTFGTFDPGKRDNLNYWRSFHPDWILYRCDRSTPAYYESGNQIIPLDFTNPAVLNWQVQRYAVPASENGYDAIAADNVDLVNTYGACGVYRDGKWVQLFSGQVDDPQWRNAVLQWLTQMQHALHQLPHPLQLIPNVGFGTIAPSSAFVQQLTTHVNGIVDESGFTEYGDGYLTDTNWLNKIQYIQNVQKQGKQYYLVGEVPSVTSAEMQWNLGNYLLCNQGRLSIFISLPQAYGQDTRYPTYNIPIGQPTGDMYQAQGVYWRDYSGGLVTVNPSSTNSHTITTSSRKYVDINGNSVSRTFTLLPHSAVILLHA